MSDLNLRHAPSQNMHKNWHVQEGKKGSGIHPLGSPAPIHRVTQDQSDSHSLSCWLDDWAAVLVLHCQLFSQPVGQPPCVPPSPGHTSSSIWSARLSLFIKSGFGLRLFFLPSFAVTDSLVVCHLRSACLYKWVKWAFKTQSGIFIFLLLMRP